jgi:hypothetical protein
VVVVVAVVMTRGVVLSGVWWGVAEYAVRRMNTKKQKKP